MPDLPEEYVFAVDMYWWAFLLTECEEQSVSMVIDTFESLDELTAAGLSCSRSQLRKTIAEKSIRAVPSRPQMPLPLVPLQPPITTFACLPERTSDDGVLWADLTTALLSFELFPRRVFLMTVLEGYSLAEAASLLGCDVNYIADARVMALCNLAAILTPSKIFHFHSN